jgi:hypothetical protein
MTVATTNAAAAAAPILTMFANYPNSFHPETWTATRQLGTTESSRI